MPKSRLYSIEIKDAKTEQVVVFAAADWTEEEKRVAVAQVMRLVGLSDESEFAPLAESGLKRGKG
jgi:hypothetical protein